MKIYVKSSQYRYVPEYVVYSEGTMRPDGRALYWNGRGAAQWSPQSEARVFNDIESQKICSRNRNGNHTWVRQKVGMRKLEVFDDPLGWFGNTKATKSEWKRLYEQEGQPLDDSDFK